MAKPKQPTDRRPVPPAAPAAQAAAPAEPPRTVRTAVTLMYAGAALSVIALIITLSTIGEQRRLVRAAQPHLSQSALDAAVRGGITTSVLIWVITIAFWIVMARTNLAGRGWARAFSSVLCALSTLSFAEDLFRPSSLLSKLVFAPLWLVGVAAIVALWRPESSAYIDAGKPARAARGN
jgi:hypothetical protein